MDEYKRINLLIGTQATLRARPPTAPTASLQESPNSGAREEVFLNYGH